MKSLLKRMALAAVLTVSVVGSAMAQSANTTPEDLLAAIEAVKAPTLTREINGDPEKRKLYMEEVAKANAERGERILAFAKAYPDHAKTPELLLRRWQTLKQLRIPLPKETLDAITADIDGVVKEIKTPDVLKVAAYQRAYVQMLGNWEDAAKREEAVDSFTKEYPTDDLGARLLNTLANADGNKSAIYERLARDYPKSPYAKYALGKVRQGRELGKPFALTFTDAVSGKTVNISDYKGKVVAIDFWATWCGPCIADLPKVKQLYADLHDKGFEIIGVSLDIPEDKGGLTKLRDFVAKENVPWAQYYQGNYWDSEFSTAWGINAIPALFLIDKNGNLVDVDAREGLAEKVKALLEKQ